MVHKKDEIVITGVSCRMPESDNIEEFKENLMNKVDMITEDSRRWTPGYYGLPKRHGKINELNKFDASFFAINPKQVNMMDPQLRILLEVVYEAILDAGINPQTLRGTRTGVFVGCSSAETQDVLIHDPEKTQGYSLTGCQHSMFANRVSFSFDFKGPSFAVDTACSSSLLAFQLAVDSIKNGTCDAALVCGTQLTLRPTSAMQFLKLGMLSPQGKCQTFDAKGDGYVRSEGIAAVLLQKESDAHRIYAEIVHAKSNTDGFKEQGITYPNGNQQAQLLREIYSEAGVDPNQVVYVECHGTGTKVGDPQETNAVAEVFCQNRTTPLLIGSVKSNMGHAEPASGLASICKVLIAAQSGYIPPNLHYTEPNPDIPGLNDNRLKVVTEKTEIADGIIGVNSFGFGGANTHVVLKFPTKHNVSVKNEDMSLPRVLTYGGRTQEAVETAFNFFEQNSFDNGVYALMSENNLQSASVYPYRGFLLYNRKNGLPSLKEIQKISTAEKRPVWFIYSGMGTHYPGMGRELLNIKIFNDTIVKCSAVLEPFGINVYDLIAKGGSDGIWCAVCICAIQVSLTETLRFLGIESDGIVGHSFGEMAAAYCDGCMTLEETMLCAYYRTKSILQGNFPPGAMAAIGMTWEEAKLRCPEGIVAACHNAKDSVTISGAKEKISKFVEELQSEGIFAKEVNSAGIAFHSHYMHTVADSMKQYLNKIITEPKRRSSKWISSSVPQEKWSTPLGTFCSAEYHVNNAVSPVLFYEAMQMVSNHAVLIEISPHCLLQAILRRCLSTTCTNVGLLKASHENNLEFFMQNLGKIYEAGLSIRVQKLYPAVRYPVGRGTPMISPIMKWDHTQDWFVISMDDMKVTSGGSNATTSIMIDSEDKFLLDHIIDGRPLFPFAGHVQLAWKTLCKLRGLDFQKTPIIIEDMTVHKATIISQQPVKLDVSVSTASGSFEILENDQVTASGKITIPESGVQTKAIVKQNFNENSEFYLTGNEVYKELRLRGYEYGPHFRPIQKSSSDGRQTEIAWSGNWITFIDAMLQTILLGEFSETMKLPVRLRYLSIDPEKHVSSVQKNEKDNLIINAFSNPSNNQCNAGGIVLRDLVAQSVARRSLTNGNLVLEKVNFVKYFNDACFSDVPKFREELNVYENLCRIAVQNIVKKLNDADVKIPNANILKNITNGLPLIKVDLDEAKIISSQNDCILLKMLREISEINFNEKDNIKILSKLLKEGFKILDQDKLWRMPYHFLVAKPMLDVVMENSTGHRLKICVMEPTSCFPVKLCQELLANQPLFKVEWTVAGPNVVDALDESQVSELALSVTKVDLDNSTTTIEIDQTFDLILLDKVASRKDDVVGYLTKARDMVREDGFLLVNEVTSSFDIMLAVLAWQGQLPCAQKNGARKYGIFYDNENWLKIFEKCSLRVVACQGHDLMTTTYLLRKISDELPSRPQLLLKLNDTKEFSWLKSVQNAVEQNNKVWLTSENGCESGAVGFGLCLKSECSKNIIRTIINANLNNEIKIFDENTPALQNIFCNDLHSNVYRNGAWGSFRHLPIKEDQTLTTVETEHAFINTLVPGDLNSLAWMESSNVFCKSTKDKHLCNVYYAALNFRDIMLATGRLSADAIPGDFNDRDCLLGMEYSGRWAHTGERIMGLAAAQALATTVFADERFTWSVPEEWTLEQAATVPVAYCTAYYSLVIRGRIKSGEKVLIHGGSGGVGQAAIAIALSYGCDVYTTTSSEEKKKYLQERFPQLQDRNFSTSRSTDFEQFILEETNGRGVDLVLNSLSEDKLQASVRCLAQHGRFLEIGKFDLSNNSNLGMSVFLKNITFHGILLDSLFGDNNPEWLEIRKLFEDGIRSGVVQPLHTTVFPVDKATDAFRYMAQGKHIGKVLMNIRDEKQWQHNDKKNFFVRAVCRIRCNPEHCFIITGGLGGFGLELTKWLIKKGAKKIVLTSRTGLRTGYQKRCFQFWSESGIKIIISTADISNKNGACQLIKEAQNLGPVGGLFHLAMVLRDNLFENQSEQAFKESAEAKHWGTKYVDDVTRRECDSEFKFFVVFSSISCGRGNPGQTNYGWSNSVMERIVEKRRADGYPGLAIQWGAIGDVGVVLENMGDNSTVIGGTFPQRIPSCLQTLELFINLNHPVVSSFVKAETVVKSKTDTNNSDDPAQIVGQILGVSNLGQIDRDAQLGDLGLDSLMGVEIKQTLERNFSLVFSAKEIRALTLNKLGDMAKQKSLKASEKN